MENYSKVRNIGKGGMGQCILVRHSSGQPYIMKLVDLSSMNKKERTASLHEAKVLSSLNHPNVIRYVDSFLSKKGDQLCIVMEWAEGGDLAAKVKQRRFLPEQQIIDWMLQICLAMRYCHGRRVFHRDIKTQNIFLTNDGVIKLGDFGISRVLANTCDNAHTFVGTPYYLSPELVQEQPYNTPSDMWALGVVLYELMALRMPFNALDMKGLMYKIMRVIYDPPPLSYSSELRVLVGKLLVKDPRARLTATELLSQSLFQSRLQALLEGPPSGTVPASYVQALLQDDFVEPVDDARSSAPSSDHALPRRSSSSARPGPQASRTRSSSLPPLPPPASKPLLRAAHPRPSPSHSPSPPAPAGPPPAALPALHVNRLPALPQRPGPGLGLGLGLAEKGGPQPNYYRAPYRRSPFQTSKQEVF